MMKTERLYRVDEDGGAWEEYGYIDGTHDDGSLPGVTCYLCGACWSIYGLAYPRVDLSSIPDYKTIFTARNVTVPVFDDIRDKVAHLLAAGTYLPPGTRFGPVSGTVIGDLKEFAWVQCAMLIERNVYHDMVSSGIKLPDGIPATLGYLEGQPRIVMIEPEVPLTTRLSSNCPVGVSKIPCLACGRIGIHTPEEMIVKASTIPSGLDVFRTWETLTHLVTARFRDYCLEHNLKNIVFREVAIAEDE
jgi:uncharacterized double-CXXCG motif protein